MIQAAIGTVVSCLEKDQENLRDVTITVLADAARWVERTTRTLIWGLMLVRQADLPM